MMLCSLIFFNACSVIFCSLFSFSEVLQPSVLWSSSVTFYDFLLFDLLQWCLPADLYINFLYILKDSGDAYDLPGPRNWHPLVLTAAQRLAESWCGYWCMTSSSDTILSPSDRAMRAARDLPSSSNSWQWIRLMSFRCMGRLRTHFEVLLLPTVPLVPPLPAVLWLLLFDGLCSLQVELSSSDASTKQKQEKIIRFKYGGN